MGECVKSAYLNHLKSTISIYYTLQSEYWEIDIHGRYLLVDIILAPFSGERTIDEYDVTILVLRDCMTSQINRSNFVVTSSYTLDTGEIYATDDYFHSPMIFTKNTIHYSTFNNVLHYLLSLFTLQSCVIVGKLLVDISLQHPTNKAMFFQSQFKSKQFFYPSTHGEESLIFDNQVQIQLSVTSICSYGSVLYDLEIYRMIA